MGVIILIEHIRGILLCLYMYIMRLCISQLKKVRAALGGVVRKDRVPFEIRVITIRHDGDCVSEEA